MIAEGAANANAVWTVALSMRAGISSRLDLRINLVLRADRIPPLRCCRRSANLLLLDNAMHHFKWDTGTVSIEVDHARI